ncbi:MAG: DMT family transporter [Anaerolineae bacterium]|nr:DMT family transporter [Anaerolineae bacterium]
MKLRNRLPKDGREQGVLVTLLSTVCFGLAPIFGKFAYRAEVTPFTLAALRTIIAVALLWAFYLVFWPQAIQIRWQNLLGCIGMGVTNGVGSLFYYTGLARLDASLTQLLWTFYPIWVFVFLSAAGHPVSRLALLRLALALLGTYLLTYAGARPTAWLGIMLILSASACYGWHLVLGQWTLADLDSRTVTLYALSAMAAVVTIARLATGMPWTPISLQGWTAILLLALIPTALARLLVFAGLSRLGGVQTSLLGVAELLVALLLAYLLLGERLSLWQWIGGGLLVASVLLIGRESSLAVSWEELLRDGRWRKLK